MMYLSTNILKVLFFIFVTSSVFSQQQLLLTKGTNINTYPEVQAVLQDFSIINCNTKSLRAGMTEKRSGQDNITIELNDNTKINFILEPVDIFSADSHIYLAGVVGKTEYTSDKLPLMYTGYSKDNPESNIRLTLNDGFLYGNIHHHNEDYFIEPMHYYDLNARYDSYLLYNTNAVKDGHNKFQCFLPEIMEESHSKDETYGVRAMGSCYKAKLAILADYSMVTDPVHPGVTAVINLIAGVLNNVQSNFEYNGATNFTDGINFEISELVVSTCASCDPLSGQTNAGLLLSEFSAWIDQGGFYHSFHGAHFWTNRDLDNTTVGVAFQSANLFCQSKARAVFEDWTATAALLKIMVSHEIGHSFNGVHDASNSNFILAPSLNINNTSWSTNSKSTISTQISLQGPNCMANCQPAICLKVENLTLASTNAQNFTVSWSASAQGQYIVRVREAGSSVFITDISTAATTVVLSPPGYGICKRYDVFVYNNCLAGGLSAPSRLFNIGPVSQGCADFIASKNVGWSGTSIAFTDKSLNATSWFWNFGNGQTSTQQNPVVNYTTSGSFDVSLTVNGTHTRTVNGMIKILPNMPAPFGLFQGGNFESNSDYFASSILEGNTNLWQYGTSNYILSTQGNAWKTGLNNDIPQLTAKCALYSPRFDFTNYQNFTLHFDIGMEIVYCNAPIAAQLQYSTNNGATWTRLGSAPSFYNAGPTANCKIAPQVFADSTGWTLNSNYLHKSIDLSFLSGNPSVIFRFVLSVSGIFNGGYNVDGVLIDNFRIDVQNPFSLPLEMQSLSVQRIDDNALLQWKAYKPADIVHYNIMRSHNGIDFVPIDTVYQPNINTENFGYTDIKTLKGDNYYRIDALCRDDKQVRTNIAFVRFKSDPVIALNPNPVTRHQTLHVITDDSGNNIQQISITDMMGRQINIPALKFENGRLNTEFLHPGLYHLHVTTSENIYQVLRFIVVE
jgi:PKD repeat protein